MLYIDNLSLRLPYYPRWWRRHWSTCLDAVTLSIEPGEVHAVIGASGAGKSLLASAIMGLLPASAHLSGELAWRGEPLTAARQRALRGRELALIPQSLNALDPLVRIRQQVMWAAQRAGHPRDQAHDLTEQSLRHYQLDATARRAFPHQLSGGMARRVLTAMAHVSRAALIIADEPSVGLDPTQRQRVLSDLSELAAKGHAVLLISHDLRHALTIAHRVTIMRAGRCLETTSACAFQGAGDGLNSAYAQALWQALPDNAFMLPAESANQQAEEQKCNESNEEHNIA